MTITVSVSVSVQLLQQGFIQAEMLDALRADVLSHADYR